MIKVDVCCLECHAIHWKTEESYEHGEQDQNKPPHSIKHL